MKATREGRTIHLSGLPDSVDGITVPKEFSIRINYADGGHPNQVTKAISLDNLIIPLILKALNTEE